MKFYFNELRFKINKIFCFDNNDFGIVIPKDSKFYLTKVSATRIEIKRNYLDSQKEIIKIVWLKKIGIVGIEDYDNGSCVNSYSSGKYFSINGEYYTTSYDTCYNKSLMEFILEYGRGPEMNISNVFQEFLEEYYIE